MSYISKKLRGLALRSEIIDILGLSNRDPFSLSDYEILVMKKFLISNAEDIYYAWNISQEYEIKINDITTPFWVEYKTYIDFINIVNQMSVSLLSNVSRDAAKVLEFSLSTIHPEAFKP